jgi:hypothetical protein
MCVDSLRSLNLQLTWVTGLILSITLTMGLTPRNTVLSRMNRVPRMYDNHSKSLETFSGRLQRELLNLFYAPPNFPPECSDKA